MVTAPATGRFATLLDLVNRYNVFFKLVLADPEQRDPDNYPKSVPSNGCQVARSPWPRSSFAG